MRLNMELGMAHFRGLGNCCRAGRWIAWLAGMLPATMLAATSGAPAGSRFEPVPLAGWVSTNAALPTLPAAAAFPTGARTFHDVPFQIAGRCLVTGMEDARNGEFFPPRLTPLVVDRKADRIHLLLGVAHDDKLGVPFAELLLHYADGAERVLRLAYGVHALSWVKDRKEQRESLVDVESRQAWSNGTDGDRSGATVRLFQTVFDNPLPGEPIAAMEWVSMFSQCTPFLAGVTLETTPGLAPIRRPELVPRVVRKSLQLKDSSYRDELRVEVYDYRNGRPLTNATASLSLTDDESTFLFGSAAADAAGVARLTFPPQQTVGYGVLVRAPGHLPVVLSRSMTNGVPLPRQLQARLETGVRVGGMVRDADGKPLAGARVNVHRVTPIGPKEYERMDYEVAVTGRDGRWVSECVPSGFTNLSLSVSHPEQRSALFVMADASEAKANVVTREALLAETAILPLPPPLRFAGVVTDAAGQAIPHAEVRLMEPGRPERPTPCDAQGRFSITAEQPGEWTLVAQAPGYAARVQSFPVEANVLELRVPLNKTQPFRGTIVDQYQSPVAGAKIRYDPSNGNRAYSWQTVSDAKGQFVWDSPPDGDVMLYISATNHSSTRISFGGAAGDHQIQLRKQSRVYGRVVDAATGKPIDEFQVIRGRSYNYEEPMRWDRYDPIRGRKGEFSMRLEEYSSSGRSQVLVEAPGYEPQASPAYGKAGIYTNMFSLKKGQGIRGRVVWSDGTPAAGVTVVLVDSGESVSMERSGELRRSSAGPAFQRSNASGHFEFLPKFDPHTVLAAHEKGYAEIPVSNLLARGDVVLQPWGRVEGVVRVGQRPEPGQSVVLQSARYNEEGRTSPALGLSVRIDPDPDGRFVFDKVPAGERSVCVQFKLSDRDSGRLAYSHAVPITVRSGEKAEVVIGGTGRSVRGRVVPMGADAEELDWRRDVSSLYSVLNTPPTISPPMFTASMTGEQRQEAMRDYSQRQAAFWRTPEGRRMQREQRSYVLLYDTNGTFRIDNVEPGSYWLNVHLTNPDRGMNYYETIGSQSFNVTVPPAAGSAAAEPLDLGEFKLPIRGFMRLGRRAPSFKVQTFDGKEIQLADFKGKFVLLDFWASWTGARTADVRMLKELFDTYAKENRLVLLGLNFDQDRPQAERAIKDSGFKWTQCYVGAWNTTDLPASFGVQGLPDALLVDPDGKIIARNLRGASLRTVVRNSLAAGRGPAGPP